MVTIKQKLLKEALDLRIKLDKLDEFIAEQSHLATISQEHLTLLQDQFTAMLSYYHTLIRRLLDLSNNEVLDIMVEKKEVVSV